MKKTEQIFDIIPIAVEDYKSKFKAAETERKAAMLQLKKEFLPDTVRYRAEVAQIEADFQAALTDAREYVCSQLMPELEDAKRRAENALTVTNTEAKKLDTLKRFADMPLSQREINILAEKYGGGYWTDRVLSQLAERNNCEYAESGAEVGESCLYWTHWKQISIVF